MVQRRIKVTRTITCSYETTWPEDYNGLEWNEVIRYEDGLDMGEVLEVMHGAKDLTKTCAIEIIGKDLTGNATMTDGDLPKETAYRKPQGKRTYGTPLTEIRD